MMKGDGVVTFLLKPSVRIAETIMHGRPLRPGAGPNMTVQEAKFQPKGEYQPKRKPAGNKGAKGKKKGPSQAEKLLSWSGFDDTHKASEVTVVLQGLFTLEELSLSPDLVAELTEYLLGRCKDLGAIDKVRVYKRSVAGVATIKFRLPEAARTAVERFASTALVARMFTPAELQADAALAKEVVHDALVKCRELGVALAAETDEATGGPKAPVCLMKGSAVGRVAVACASAADAQRCVAGIAGLGYAGTQLEAAPLAAYLWGMFCCACVLQCV